MAQDSSNLIWIDLEMTGLNAFTDRILEIATVVTDANLNLVAEGPQIAVKQPEHLLGAMDEWNRTQHQGSGLLDRVRSSTWDEAAAESETVVFLKKHVPQGKSPMCGNSICQDRRFLARCMPELESYFHYRNLDVSTLKELVNRWRPELVAGFSKQSRHLALDDIRDSIAELSFYRQHFLRVD